MDRARFLRWAFFDICICFWVPDQNEKDIQTKKYNGLKNYFERRRQFRDQHLIQTVIGVLVFLFYFNWEKRSSPWPLVINNWDCSVVPGPFKAGHSVDMGLIFHGQKFSFLLPETKFRLRFGLSGLNSPLLDKCRPNVGFSEAIPQKAAGHL